MNVQTMMKYNVDLVFCIDATGSMKPLLDTVKENALHFYRDVMTSMEEKHKSINTFRVRIVMFRDYCADHDQAMLTTDFFNLPDETKEFEEAIRSIDPCGGGDEPEDGLEALGYAIRSPWNNEGIKNRSVIVVWTDASTHPIGYAAGEPEYPRNMARDFSELTEWRGDEQIESPFIKNNAKRLILFAPDKPYWSDISDSWNQVIHCPSKAGGGLEEYAYKEIINTISNSI